MGIKVARLTKNWAANNIRRPISAARQLANSGLKGSKPTYADKSKLYYITALAARAEQVDRGCRPGQSGVRLRRRSMRCRACRRGSQGGWRQACSASRGYF